MRRIVFDLDGTLTLEDPGKPYEDRQLRPHMRELLLAYKARGFTIVIATSRNMNTHGSAVGVITAKTLPVIFAWLDRHGIPYDEVFVGKPWCGKTGFYVDDKAIRPSEFRDLSFDQIIDLLAREHAMAIDECGN